MTEIVQKLAKDCESLSLEEVAELHDVLTVAVHTRAGSEEMDEVWSGELRRRLERIRSGKAKLIPAEDVFARAKDLHTR